MLNLSGSLNIQTGVWCYYVAEIRKKVHAISLHHAKNIKQ